MNIQSDPAVQAIFENYPKEVRPKMQQLRELVFQTAEEMEEIDQLEECTKWNEPSYITKIGSTLRMDWKPRSPDQYALYFNCSSRLVATFKLVFADQLEFEGNRAIVLGINDDPPVSILKRCIKSALRYHKVKDELTLGI